MTKIVFRCPYPPAKLNPNRSKGAHWASVSRERKPYRKACWQECLAAGGRKNLFDGTVFVTIAFHPPDKRRRDKDNMIAAFKSGQDGIADAIQVDDGDWFVSHVIREPVKGGCVEVTIESNPLKEE